MLARSPSAYADFAGDIAALLDEARRQAARSVNAILTATYWEIGRRVVEFEQKGEERAEYGEELLVRLSQDLTARFGRGFSRQNLQQMRQFYLIYPPEKICQTVSGKFEIPQAPFASSLGDYLALLAQAFPLSWSHYVRLLSVKTPEARAFYVKSPLPPFTKGGRSVTRRMVSTATRPPNQLVVLRADRAVKEQSRYADQRPKTEAI